MKYMKLMLVLALVSQVTAVDALTDRVSHDVYEVNPFEDVMTTQRVGGGPHSRAFEGDHEAGSVRDLAPGCTEEYLQSQGFSIHDKASTVKIEHPSFSIMVPFSSRFKSMTKYTSVNERSLILHAREDKEDEIWIYDEGGYTFVDIFIHQGNVVKCGPYKFNKLISRIHINLYGGDDIFDATQSSIPTIVDGGSGNDSIMGSSSTDRLYGGAGEDLLYGFDGADHIFGGDENDELYGGKGADTLSGGKSDDILYGESGKDALNGGEGWDTYYCGTGNEEQEKKEYPGGSNEGNHQSSVTC